MKRTIPKLIAVVLFTSLVAGFAANSPGTNDDAAAKAHKLVTAVARREDVEAIQKLLDEGVDINARDEGGMNAWLMSRLRGFKELSDFLESKGADTKTAMPPRNQIAEHVLNQVAKSNAPALAVLVAKDGKVLFEKAYGLADMDGRIPATTETKFRIGSLTKQFTASAILKLQEEGKLSVEDKLSKCLPDFPRGDEVTLRHLLTHTSGIHSYTSKPDFTERVTNPIEETELINWFKNDPYDFDPGKKWLYDNSGYFLLGYIIEKVSGKSYEEYLRQTLFAPLGMDKTGAHHAKPPLKNEALGYAFQSEGHFDLAKNWDMTWAGGAGVLYSTIDDLFKWNEAVFNGKVLKESSLKAAFTPVRTEEAKDGPADVGYGFGWGITKKRGSQQISHSGGLPGFASYLLRMPKEKFTVTVLSASMPDAPGAEPGVLANRLLEVYLGDTLAPAPPVPKANKNVSTDALNAVAGRYDYGGAVLTVMRRGEKIYAQLGDQPEYEIFPKSDTEYFWKVVDAQVTFVKDSSGKVTKAIHHQNGNTINAARLPDLAEMKVSPADYDALVGKYRYGQATMAVTRRGSQLFAQLTGQAEYEIFPKSATEFFWKAVPAEVTFVKDENGKVVKAVHHQNGKTFDAPRL